MLPALLSLALRLHSISHRVSTTRIMPISNTNASKSSARPPSVQSHEDNSNAPWRRIPMPWQQSKKHCNSEVLQTQPEETNHTKKYGLQQRKPWMQSTVTLRPAWNTNLHKCKALAVPPPMLAQPDFKQTPTRFINHHLLQGLDDEWKELETPCTKIREQLLLPPRRTLALTLEP